MSGGKEERRLRLIFRVTLEKIFPHHNRGVHIRHERIVVRLVARVRHDLPPLDQSHQEIRKRMPTVTRFQVTKLEFGFVELEIIQVIQGLGAFQLDVQIGDEDYGCILPGSGL